MDLNEEQKKGALDDQSQVSSEEHSRRPTSLMELPRELVWHIVAFLHLNDVIMGVALSSRTLRHLILPPTTSPDQGGHGHGRDDEAKDSHDEKVDEFWRQYVMRWRLWPPPYVISQQSPPPSWRIYCRQQQRLESFEGMDLREELVHSIHTYRFSHPSEVHKAAIVPLAHGKRDIVVCCPFGPDRIVCYAAGIVQRIEVEVDACQALVLVPTRELAHSITELFHRIGSGVGVKTLALFGGTPIQRSPILTHVVVGTPGRTCDAMCGKVLSTDSLKVIIFEGLDGLVSLGFESQLRFIRETVTHSDVQVGVFSDVIMTEDLDLINTLTHDPIIAKLPPKPIQSLHGIAQFYVNCEHEERKYDRLIGLLKERDVKQAIIFCNTMKKAEWLAERMSKDIPGVPAVHNCAREETFNPHYLITTDRLLADWETSRLVINFELPVDKKRYLSRASRLVTQRYKVISLVTNEDMPTLREIEQLENTSIRLHY